MLDYLVINEYMVITDYLVAIGPMVVTGVIVDFGLKIANTSTASGMKHTGHGFRSKVFRVSGGLW